ncbi:hypothetical protein RhiirA5_477871 [Rhizophagus irregularis]|uniref:Uncharacterized protein n=2 Tax=Rhizophagus irregularis TaxID=588596 RepID=A0A2I1EPD3_9GLOM|nr:hypothetical protein RhiirA5_477871 [Rhizophagus irregularis]PKC63993.1 hypothetical protein RhiirA1_517868 [Rhizophagus irregularis]PKY23987.1 hypothetical protein RhiirB3_507375 [Rhizophagus irregularis]
MVALKDGRIRLIRSLLLGSIILNLLLVSGMRFNNIKKQKFNGLSLTTLAYNSLIIPAAFNFDVESIDNQLLSLPYVMATVILIFTILYRYFQIKPNLDLYHEERQHQRLSVVLSLFFFWNRPSLTPKLLDSSLDLEAGIDKMMSHLMKYLIEDESTQEELRKANRSEVKLNICWKILSIKRMEEQRKRETERKEREDRRQTGIEFTNF